MLKRRKLSKKESKRWFGYNEKESNILKDIFILILDREVEVLKDVEDDLFGFDRWKDWRLKVGNFGCISNFIGEINLWNDILSDFNGEYDSIMFGECYKDYLNDFNNIKDKELRKEVIDCFNWSFEEWIKEYWFEEDEE
jgi:hypothetical protein